MKRIYLDHAATTPLDGDVSAAMMPYFSEQFGNPSSVHSYGREAQQAVDRARHMVADVFGCLSQEVIFTGSATESNNFAIQGVVRNAQKRGNPVHVITSSIEHESVTSPCKQMEREGVSVTYLPVSQDGFIDPTDVAQALTEHTVLVSVMYANNEIGTIQPISEISEIIQEHNLKTKSYKLKTVFHTDAAQAAYFLPCRVADLGVDLMTVSGHKAYGPKGTGVLYVKKNTELIPLIFGSGQEYGKRSGTENVPGIVGISTALAKAVADRDETGKRIIDLRDHLIARVCKEIPGASLNGSQKERLPGNANFLFRGTRSQDLLYMLDEEGVAASAGSACQSKALSYSHVLHALGLSEKDANASIRFSLGKDTTKKDIDSAVSILVKSIRKLQE